jgi:hypothetical protein
MGKKFWRTIQKYIGKELTNKEKSLILKHAEKKGSTAAEELQFGPQNYRAKRFAPPSAQIISTAAGVSFRGICFNEDKFLVIRIDNTIEGTVKFTAGVDYSSNDVIGATQQAPKNVESLDVSFGESNDFVIMGGKGKWGDEGISSRLTTWEQINMNCGGRKSDNVGVCLVNGWEVINESDLTYTTQRLYTEADLSSKWGVAPLLKPLPQPDDGLYFIYLTSGKERLILKRTLSCLSQTQTSCPLCV